MVASRQWGKHWGDENVPYLDGVCVTCVCIQKLMNVYLRFVHFTLYVLPLKNGKNKFSIAKSRAILMNI